MPKPVPTLALANDSLSDPLILRDILWVSLRLLTIGLYENVILIDRLSVPDDLERERTKLKTVAEKSWRAWCADLKVEIDDDLAREWRNAWAVGLEQRETGSPGFFEDLAKTLAHIRVCRFLSVCPESR